MAISSINFSNTFSQWLTITNQIISKINTLDTGNYDKTAGTLTISSSGTGLIVSNTSTFTGLVDITGSGSSLHVAGPTTLSNTISVSGNSTFQNEIFVTNKITSNTILSNTISVSGNSTFQKEIFVTNKITSNTIDTINSYFYSIALKATSNTANQVLTTLPINSIRSVEFQIQANSLSNVHTTKVSAMHDGSTPFITEYGTLSTNSALATFDCDINSGNLRLITSPTLANTWYKVIVSAIKI